MANVLTGTVLVLGALALAACGGGGGSGSTGPVIPTVTPTPGSTAGPTTPPPSATSTARVTITDPSTGTFARKRRPSHLPASTKSVAVSVNGGTPVSFPYVVNGPTCVVSATTNVCTFDVPVPTGNVTLLVQALNARGKALSSATVQQLVSGTTVVPVTLAGIPVTASVSPTLITAPAGTATTVPLTISAQDLDGNTISGPFANPVTLVDSDASGHSSISPNPVPDSTGPVNLVLDGKPVNLRISAAGSLSAGIAVFASSLATHEFTVPSGQTTASNGGTGSIVLGGDGAMWFGEQTGIGRVDVNGAITEYPMVQPQQMVRGADGAVWFTTFFDSSNGQNGELCRVAPNGTVTKLNPGLFISRLTVGPDGNFWAVDGNAYVARVTTSGTVTKFPLTASGGNASHANDVSVGPDGNLWVFDESLNTLDVVTTAGTQIASVAITPPPQNGTGLSHSTFGSDGAFWFATNEIGRVSTAGALTELQQISGTLLVLNGIGFSPPILAASDNNIWTTGNWFGPAALFRVVPATNAVLTLPLPIVKPVNSVQPPAVGIANGPNGTIWFVRANAVGWFSSPG
jgi:sugar lactone lactonase YvrE